MGAVTPIGNDAETFWANLLAGVPGGGPITSFDTAGFDVKIAAEVKDFDPTIAMDRKMARRMSRFIHFGMAAATEAVNRSGLDFSSWTPEQRDRAAVVLNTGGGGMEQAIEGANTIREGPGQVSLRDPGLGGPWQVSIKPSSPARHDPGGRALGHRLPGRLVRGGMRRRPRRIRGALLAMAFAALSNMGALSKRNDDPQGASRPFDRTRDGFVFGEGAGIMVIESAEHALARGAPILAELIGAALTADAFHISAPEPTGRGAAMAMTGAMRHAGIGPADVDYLVAHGTSTPLNDVTETKAIKRAFGERAASLAISSPKSMVGHMLGAAGAVAGSPRLAPSATVDPADDQLPRA
jgi:3-oxoacyl-[acyl-carrier-protein] synthase II